MKIINTATFDAATASPFERLAMYNAMDCLVTAEVLTKTKPLLDETTHPTYEFEKSLQGPVLEMMLNGVLVDQSIRSKLVADETSKLDKLEIIAATLAEAVGYQEYFINLATRRLLDALEAAGCNIENALVAIDGDSRRDRKYLREYDRAAFDTFLKTVKFYSQPFNAKSPRQKAELLYDMRKHGGVKGPFGIQPKLARNSKGEMTPTVNRDALEALYKEGWKIGRGKYYHSIPFTATILAIMDASKTLGQLRCKLDTDGHFRTTYSIGGTETGRFSSYENPMGKGNNAQNWTPDLRSIFTCPPGWKLAAPDLEQAESRAVGAIHYRIFGDERYLDATESGDLHTLVCAMIWPQLPWPDEFNIDAVRRYGKLPREMINAAKKIANREFYRGKTYRDMAKRGGHLSNYMGQAFTMARSLHIIIELARHFRYAYFDAFPSFPRWHRWVAEQIQTRGTMTTFLGRRRRFFGRPFDDTTLREAIAFEPQSVATGDYTNAALLSIWKKHYPIKMFLQKHDEIGFAFKEEDEDWIIPQVCSLMEQHMVIYSPSGTPRDFAIPAEPMTGWNLGYKSADNPDGLAFWDKHDARVRTSNPTTSLLAQRVS